MPVVLAMKRQGFWIAFFLCAFGIPTVLGAAYSRIVWGYWFAAPSAARVVATLDSLAAWTGPAYPFAPGEYWPGWFTRSVDGAIVYSGGDPSGLLGVHLRRRGLLSTALPPAPEPYVTRVMLHLRRTHQLEPDSCGRCQAEVPRSYAVGLGSTASGDSIVVISVVGHEVVNDTHAFYQGAFRLLPDHGVESLVFDCFRFDAAGVEGFPTLLAIAAFCFIVPLMLGGRLLYWGLRRLQGPARAA